MSSDLRVFIEHKIKGEWVLVDLDPLDSADRNSARLKYLCEAHQAARPTDLSTGVAYWLSAGVCFIASLSPVEAVSIWHQTEIQPHLSKIEATDLKALLLNHFGLWDIEMSAWRVIAAIS